MGSAEDVRGLLTALVTGEAGAALKIMTAAPTVQDQRLGRLEGPEGLRRWVADSAEWLGDMDAELHEVNVIVDDRHAVFEGSFDITTSDGRVDLPYVVVADRTEQGFSEVRSYHSTWPYTGEHAFRAPPLAGRKPDPMPELFEWYVGRLRVADVEAILARFTDDGYLREPSGNRWVHGGPEGRATFYGHLEHAPRARFDLMGCTQGEDIMAIEYAFAYGKAELVGGVCIMETRGDRIHAVRVTDDVAP